MKGLWCGAMFLAIASTSVSDAQQAAHPDSVVPLRPIEVVASLMTSAGPNVRSGFVGYSHQMTSWHLRAWNPGTPVDALRNAGISAYDDLGSSFKQSAVIRGFTVGPIVGMPQGISVFLDGVPMNELGSGDVAFDLLPLDDIERVEVLTGTASLLGPNSLGGAINFITRAGGPRMLGLEAAGGSYKRLRTNAHAGGTAGNWNYYSGAAHDREGGWRRLMRAERTHLFATVGKYANSSGVRFQILGAHSYAQTAGSLPASVFAVRPDSNLTAGDFELLRQVQFAASGYATVLGGFASSRFYLRANDAERFNVNQAADPDVRSFSDSRTAGVEWDWRKSGVVAGSKLHFRAGAGATANRTRIQLFAERIEPGQTTHVQSPVTRFDAYAVTDWEVNPLTISGGIRLDLIRMPFRNLLNSARDTTSTFTNLSPRMSFSLRLSPRTSAFASVSHGFRAPALIEIACADPEEPCPLPFALGDDPPINPVRVITYETGLSYLFNRIALQGVIYRSDVSDDIFLFPYHDESEPTSSTIDGYFGNVPRTRRTGLDLRAQANFTEHLRGHVNYTSSRAAFQSGGIEIFSIREAGGAENEVESGDRFPLVPGYTLNVGLDAELRSLRLGVSAAAVGSRHLRGDEANDEPRLPAYATADTRIGYARNVWEIMIIVRNIFDARYASFGGFNINQGAGDRLERFLTPGAPRRIELTIQREL